MPKELERLPKPAEYQGPIFDATHTTGHHGGAVVPDRYLQISQGRIMDMLPNEPGMAKYHSVLRDRKSNHRFIYTYDNLASYITPSEVQTKPFICRIMEGLGKTSIEGYVLDYRRVHNLMHPSVDLRYDPELGLESIQRENEIHGAVPALAAIMRYGGEVHYVGEAAAIESASRFAQAVDDLVDGTPRGGNITCPAYPDGFEEFHRPVDEEMSLSYSSYTDKLR